MPRVRTPPLAFALCAGALTAILAWAATDAVAQTSPGSSLMRPELDGDPRNPPRFRRAPGAAKDAPRAQSTFSTPEASGVGNTGFNSTNARKKAKAKAKAKANANAGKKAELPPYPGRFGATPTNPLAPQRLAVQRPTLGPERKAAAPYDLIRPTPPQDAPPLRRRVIPDLTPFDPIGVQVGAFNFRPAIEVIGGYDTNPARTLNATPSLYSVVAPELKFNSNWARHEFTGDLRGTYTSYKETPEENRPSFDGKLNGRVDVTSTTRLDLENRLVIGTDNPGSPNIQAGLKRLPIFTTWGGTAGLGQRFNRFDIAVKGGAERTIYQNSTFTDGSTASNEDRDYNRYSVVTRGSYELTPGVKPFVETGVDQRVHDLEVDFDGQMRNSQGIYVKGGSTFELTRILTGEAAVGWIQRRYQDPTLPNISGVTVDGSLIWVASALTTAKLTATTRVDESTVFGVSGVFTREVALQVDHAFRRWLIATLKVSYGNDDYVGSTRDDNRYSVSAGIIYKLNRDLHLRSELRRDWLRSSVPSADYNANVVLFGVRLQR